jgi:hypothetical protein
MTGETSMSSLAISLIPALTHPDRSDRDEGKIYVIVPKDQAYLADLLTKRFEGQGRVEVVVDRRRAERRTQRHAVSLNRRRADRRRFHEQMVQIVIGQGSRRGGPPEASP